MSETTLLQMGNRIAQLWSDMDTHLNKNRTWKASDQDPNYSKRDPHPGWTYLISDDGYTINLKNSAPFEFNRDKDRLTASPSNLKYADGTLYTSSGSLTRPFVTVAASRPTLNIARDLYRRIVPPVIAWVDEAQGIIDNVNQKRQQQKDDIQRLKQHFGMTGNSIYRETVGGRGWSARVGYGGGVSELDIHSISTDKAIQIIELLKA